MNAHRAQHFPACTHKYPGVAAPLVVHVLIIVLLIVVTYHLLFPIIEPKRRAMLVWRFTQGRLTAKSLFALYFGLIVSTSMRCGTNCFSCWPNTTWSGFTW